MIQVWFDDTGKDGRSPFFVLAGAVAPLKRWAALADKWDKALKGKPRPLDYFKAYEAYSRCGQFAGWEEAEVSEKIKELTTIIERFLSGNWNSIVFFISWEEHGAIIKPILNPKNWRMRRYKNPFFLGLVHAVGAALREARLRPTREHLHVLFELGTDDRRSLERAYEHFVEEVEKNSPQVAALLHNRKADFRDDKCEAALQVADLFAWHARKHLEAEAIGKHYDDPIWLRLEKVLKPNYHRCDEKDLLDTRSKAIELQQTEIANSPDPAATIERLKHS